MLTKATKSRVWKRTIQTLSSGAGAGATGKVCTRKGTIGYARSTMCSTSPIVRNVPTYPEESETT